MDNASKALIIAGAILIAVMLVSLGVMLYNTAAGVAETTVGSVESLGVAGFNAQFETFFGDGKSKSQAAGLVSKVIANNANNDVEVSIDWSGEKITDLTNDPAKTTPDLSLIRDAINGAKNKRYEIKTSSSNPYYGDGTIQTILIAQESR